MFGSWNARAILSSMGPARRPAQSSSSAPTARHRGPGTPGKAFKAVRRAGRLAVVMAIAGGLSLPQVAFAHGDEGTVPARESVLQAIALVVNTPDDTAAIADKLTDAKDSNAPAGVNLAEVDEAMKALDAGNMPRVRTLLEAAIGAKSDLSGLDVRHVLQVPAGLPVISLATGQETGTLVVTDELPGRGPLTAGDAALIAAAAVAAAAGILLSIRYRPTHSIHVLRSQASHVQGG